MCQSLHSLHLPQYFTETPLAELFLENCMEEAGTQRKEPCHACPYSNEGHLSFQWVLRATWMCEQVMSSSGGSKTKLR